MKFLKELLSGVSKEVAPKLTEDELVLMIHNEVDSLEEQSIKAVNELLSKINIPTEGKINDKANLMKSLGFGDKNETIKQSNQIQESISESIKLQKINKEKLELINKYRLAYPKDKIIPMSEFEKILTKYDLIYAPNKTYIKDVPEKNLLEIKNSKSVEFNHIPEHLHIISDIHFNSWPKNSNLISKLNYENIEIPFEIKLEPWVTFTETSSLKTIASFDSAYYSHKATTLEMFLRSYNNNGYSIVTHYNKEKKALISESKLKFHVATIVNKRCNNKYSVEEIMECIASISNNSILRTDLFIAAPKTHFDLNILGSYSGREYYNKQSVKITMIKDPIAFYLLKGPQDNTSEEFVRIISKWGTSDDQSYLDPIVQDEKMN